MLLCCVCCASADVRLDQPQQGGVPAESHGDRTELPTRRGAADSAQPLRHELHGRWCHRRLCGECQLVLSVASFLMQLDANKLLMLPLDFAKNDVSLGSIFAKKQKLTSVFLWYCHLSSLCPSTRPYGKSLVSVCEEWRRELKVHIERKLRLQMAALVTLLDVYISIQLYPVNYMLFKLLTRVYSRLSSLLFPAERAPVPNLTLNIKEIQFILWCEKM